MASANTSAGAGQGETELGLDENVEGTIAYLFGLLSGVVLYFAEDNEFVRFHAAQSIVVSLVAAVVLIGVNVVTGIIQLVVGLSGAPGSGILSLLFFLLSFGVFIVVVAAWLFLMLRAFQGQRYRVPILASFADSLL